MLYIFTHIYILRVLFFLVNLFLSIVFLNVPFLYPFFYLLFCISIFFLDCLFELYVVQLPYVTTVTVPLCFSFLFFLFQCLHFICFRFRVCSNALTRTNSCLFLAFCNLLRLLSLSYWNTQVFPIEIPKYFKGGGMFTTTVLVTQSYFNFNSTRIFKLRFLVAVLTISGFGCILLTLYRGLVCRRAVVCKRSEWIFVAGMSLCHYWFNM